MDEPEFASRVNRTLSVDEVFPIRRRCNTTGTFNKAHSEDSDHKHITNTPEEAFRGGYGAFQRLKRLRHPSAPEQGTPPSISLAKYFTEKQE